MSYRCRDPDAGADTLPDGTEGEDSGREGMAIGGGITLAKRDVEEVGGMFSFTAVLSFAWGGCQRGHFLLLPIIQLSTFI